MAQTIDVAKADDPRDVVHRAVQALVEGKVVAFPTETVYGLAVSGLQDSAVDRLLEVKRRPEGLPLALAIRSADEALDYVPNMPPVGLRLARRCWPGPITLVLNDNSPESVIKRLPQRVYKAVAANGTVGLRVPAHSLILSVLRLIPGPLLLTSANRSGQPDATNAQQILDTFGNEIDLVLDDGRSKFGQASSVVHISDSRIEILRRGVISDAALKRLASFIALFVCTGNTCRSPMAELLMRHRIAEKLGCGIEELEDRGVLITSAGIAAMAGGRAAAEAVRNEPVWPGPGTTRKPTGKRSAASVRRSSLDDDTRASGCHFGSMARGCLAHFRSVERTNRHPRPNWRTSRSLSSLRGTDRFASFPLA